MFDLDLTFFLFSAACIKSVYIELPLCHFLSFGGGKLHFATISHKLIVTFQDYFQYELGEMNKTTTLPPQTSVG